MAGAMEKPVWTVCFGLIWILLAAGAVVCHFALAEVNPALKGFPLRLEEGFEDVLGLGKLDTEIKNVKAECDKVLGRCGVPYSDCQKLFAEDTATVTACHTKTTDSSANKAAVLKSFDDGLEKIVKLGEDKYLGVDMINTVGGQLDDLKAQLGNFSSTGDCCPQAVGYCKIAEKSLVITDEVGEVKKQIRKMTDNDAVDEFEAMSDQLTYLHALPYILVLSTVFFTLLWVKNGTCCCCKGGKAWHAGPVLGQCCFWLIAFNVMTVIAGVGYAVEFWLMEMPIPPGTFKNDPKVGELLDHIQDVFPDFWKYVFDDLISGLEMLRNAATIFVAVCLWVAVYSCAFCGARPYEDKGNE